MRNKGLIFVVSGPSGSGKGTILPEVIKSNPNFMYSVSNTTRKNRRGEVNGVDYNYITKEAFLKNIEEDKMLEWAVFSGEYYGTPKEPVEKALNEGKDVFLELEVQGALIVKEKIKDAIKIFIMPPSYEELKKRLLRRATDTEESQKKRLKAAIWEISEAYNYNYVVLNDKVEDAIDDIKSIINAEKCKYNNMKIKIDEVLKNV